MNTVQIPNVPFTVSQICLGCAYYGNDIPTKLSHEIMDYYYDQGGRFFNTAHEYSKGTSEMCLGQWIASRGIRDKIIVTTKGGEDVKARNFCAMHREDLLQDIDESLTRLKLDYVDFYMLHVDDPTVGVDELLDTLEEIRKNGKIRYYGCSNWSPDRQRSAAAYAREKGIQGFVIDEIEFNLARNIRSNRGICKWLDEDFIALHEEDGVCVGGYSALASGIFSKYAKENSFENWPNWCCGLYDNPYSREIGVRLKKLSDETGWSISQIQLAWLTEHPYNFSSFLIIGASKLSQMQDSLGYSNVHLTREMKEYLHPDPKNFPEGHRID